MLWILGFALLGLIFGIDGFGRGGWMIGAALGAVFGYCLQLARRVSQLEKQLHQLSHLADAKTSADEYHTEHAPPSSSAVSTPHKNLPPFTHIPMAARTHSATHAEFDAQEPSADPWTTPPAKPQAKSEAPLNKAAYTSAESAEEISPTNRAPSKPSATNINTGKEFNPLGAAFDFVYKFFTQGNPVVRIGVVILFFGVSFLLKYAAERSVFPIELRFVAVALLALALIVVGWITRARTGNYGLVLQGGGIGLFYLTVFAAAKLYGLIGLPEAFVALFVLVMLGSTLAVLQNALSLALLSSIGGFLAPILTSSGSGNHIALFSYYLLLNIGILGIAWFKSWRLLNLTGFAFTFGIAIVWGALSYKASDYQSSQLFLIAYFLLFFVVSILFALRQPPKLKGLVDGSLVFGLPIIAFGMQNHLVGDTEYGLAVSALLLAALYLLTAFFLQRKQNAALRLLVMSLIAIGAMFATIAVPLALDAQWTSATWALEGLALVWLGLQQQQKLPRFSGYALQFAAFISLLSGIGVDAGDTAFLSGSFFSTLILSLAGVAITYCLDKWPQPLLAMEKMIAGLFLVWGLIWWGISFLIEIFAHATLDWQIPLAISFVSLSALTLYAIEQKLPWPRLMYVGVALLPLAILFSLTNDISVNTALPPYAPPINSLFATHPFTLAGLIAYSLFFCVQYFLLRKKETHWQDTLLTLMHSASGLFLLLLVFWEMHWQFSAHALSGETSFALWIGIYAIPILITFFVHRLPRWPFALHSTAYQTIIPSLPLALCVLWFLAAIAQSGSVGTLPYLPILNLMDLGQAAVLLLFAYALRQNLCHLQKLPTTLRYGALGFAIFLWLNLVLLRALHHYLNVPYSAYALWHSMTVQMALTILWSVLALIVMFMAKHWQQRQVWMVGASLLALVVLKLFFKELADSGTLTRIVSFLVVGGFMLLIGYLSPLPPKMSKQETE